MKKIILAAAILISPLFINTVYACSCVQISGSPEHERASRLADFKNAAAVFTGEVVELAENKVVLKVEKLWKGDTADEITMVTQVKQKSDGRYVRTSCDYNFELGKKYLVFAYEREGDLTTFQCTRTTSFEHREIVEEETLRLDEITQTKVKSKK